MKSKLKVRLNPIYLILMDQVDMTINALLHETRKKTKYVYIRIDIKFLAHSIEMTPYMAEEDNYLLGEERSNVVILERFGGGNKFKVLYSGTAVREGREYEII